MHRSLHGLLHGGDGNGCRSIIKLDADEESVYAERVELTAKLAAEVCRARVLLQQPRHRRLQCCVLGEGR